MDKEDVIHTYTHRDTHRHTHRHTQEYYSAIKNNEIIPFVATWIGEGNGTPLQYSCLENPMGGGAW